MNPWVALIAAGLCEIGWPLGLRAAHLTPSGQESTIFFRHALGVAMIIGGVVVLKAMTP
ncbi:hypothetical protein ACUZ9P_06395 [Desulfovibrio sp. QI0430]